MSGPNHETLTAALRRLADEHATGLLAVATPGADVIIELAAGTPVSIGPVHDVRDRVGDDATDGVVTAAVIDELVDRTVAAVVDGDVDWTWDAPSSADRLPLPGGLIQELARRAVDGAQALGTTAADDVLVPVDGIATTGEVARVRSLFDGTRTVADVASQAGLELPTVAVIAAALLDGGALAPDEQDAPPEAATSWTDTVADADPVDADEDEPEPWVMGSEEDDPVEDVDPVQDADGDAPATLTAPVRLAELRDVAVPEPEEPQVAVGPGGDPQDLVAAAAEDDQATWNDTSWLDDLSTPDADGGPPVLAAGEDEADTRVALGSMLSELQREVSRTSLGEQPPPRAQPRDDGPDDDDATPPAPKREPKAEPGEVAEFLRELSRLALDDD